MGYFMIRNILLVFEFCSSEYVYIWARSMEIYYGK